MDDTLTKSQSVQHFITAISNINNKSNSTPVSGNRKKRKLDEYDVDNNHNKPNKKKRKCNENNTNNDQHALTQSNESLKIQNYELKQQNGELTKETHHYKQILNTKQKEREKWKSDYMKLYSKLRLLTNISNLNLNNTESDIDTSATSPTLKIEQTNTNIDDHSDTNDIVIKHEHQNNTTLKIENTHKSITNNNNTLPLTLRNSTNTATIVDLNNQNNNVLKLEFNEIEFTNNKYDSIRDRLLEMGFDKNEIANKISAYDGSGEDPQFVFNQILNTFTHTSNTKRKTRKKRNLRKKKNNKRELDDILFEDSYIISVNCHICQEHFDDIHKYRDHLQQHYESDPERTWLICDLEDCNYEALDSTKFVGHIATHRTNKPYKCNMTLDGVKCVYSIGYKWDIKKHWEQHCKPTTKKKYRFKKKRKSNTSSNNKVPVKQVKHNHNHNHNHKNNKRNVNRKQSDSDSDIEHDNENDPDYVDFEDSYYFSVHCHICQMHFDDYYEYRDHVQDHYNNSPTLTWRQCDLGCEPTKPLCHNSSDFISHISQHTNDKPFKCNVLINGDKCNSTSGTKSNMKIHWKLHYKTQLSQQNNKRKKRKSKAKSKSKRRKNKNKNNNKKSQRPKAKIKNKNKKKQKKKRSTAFEDSFHISVTCHICNKHFDDFYEYKMHLAKHYKTNPNKKWRQCDFGCVVNPDKPLFKDDAYFISHIATHTKDKPFKCDMLINGEKCVSSCGSRNNFRQHWKLHLKNAKGIINMKKTKIKAITPYTHVTLLKKNHIPKIVTSKMITDINFESSYHVSIDCHICAYHFVDFYEYRNHIRQHYENNPSQEWLKCDFKGCKNNTFKSHVNFLCHIASHTNKYPFKCNIIDRNGNQCKGSSGTKANLKQHWNAQHNIYNNKKGAHKLMYDSEESSSGASDSDSDNSNSNSGSETDSVTESESEGQVNGNGNGNGNMQCGTEFEKSYIFSVNCHMCNEHFDNYYGYRNHMEQHYDESANKKWLQCDWGCTNRRFEAEILRFKDSAAFLCHISSHTKRYPFKCNVVMNGNKCKYASGVKSNLKSHWNLYHKNKYNKAYQHNDNSDSSQTDYQSSTSSSSSSSSQSE